MSSSPQHEDNITEGIIVLPQQPNLNNITISEQPVTEEERQWMIDDVKQKAKSLHELLINYRAMEDKLKEEVMECVLRDIHEQNIHIGINKRVQSAQQDLLNDTAYVGWAMKNGKGEFAASFGRPKNQQEKIDNDNNNNNNHVSWKDLIINSGNEINPLNLPLSTLILPPRISLILGSFQQLDHEDSTVPETLKTRFASFLTLVEVWKQRVEAQFLNGKEPAVLLLNGIPLFGSQSSIPSAQDKKKLLSKEPSSSSVEENVSNLLNECFSRSASSPNSIQDIFSMESKLSKSFFHSLLKQGTNSVEMMATSEFPSHDTLSLVPLKKLQDSLLVYVLATNISSNNNNNNEDKLQIVAIEPVVSSFALHVAKGFTSVNSIRTAVETFCQQVVARMGNNNNSSNNKTLPRRSVFTIALSGSDPSSSILLDVCELTPQLPTTLLSWGDVCSILRQQNTNTNNTPTNDAANGNNVLFRGQKSKVASLKDAIENEKEEENNNNNNNNENKNDNSVGGCFLQMIEDTMNFDEQQQHQKQIQEISDGESVNYAKAAVFLAAGAALVTGAFLALKKK